MAKKIQDANESNETSRRQNKTATQNDKPESVLKRLTAPRHRSGGKKKLVTLLKEHVKIIIK